MQSILEKIGFYNIERSIPALRAQAERMVENAGTPENCEKFEALPSHIDPSQAKSHLRGVLAIDVGGTHSRVGVRIADETRTDWFELINVFNDELNSGSAEGSALQRFAREMAQRACLKLKERGIEQSLISGLGVVWSNALSNSIKNGSIIGVVTQREHYKKNEWFISDLNNGTEINAPFVEAFKASGLKIDVSLVGNDTPLTFKAAPNSDAGAVVSTGMNGTIVKSLKGESRMVICNAEMGGRMIVPVALRSEADILDEGLPAQYLESLSSGRPLPQLFNSYIRHLAGVGVGELKPLAKTLGSVSEFKAADLSYLLLKPETFISTFRSADLLTPGCVKVLADISKALLIRAARLSAIMAYATICNQLGSKERFRIALESRLCREVPLFHQTMIEQLSALMPSGKSAELVLLEPLRPDGGSISVPMQGAAAALDNLAF